MDMKLRKILRDFVNWQGKNNLLKDELTIDYELAETYLEEIRDEAINFTDSCTELKEKHKTDFEEWLKDKFIKISDIDYTNKDQDCIWSYYELEDIYKLMK